MEGTLPYSSFTFLNWNTNPACLDLLILLKLLFAAAAPTVQSVAPILKCIHIKPVKVQHELQLRISTEASRQVLLNSKVLFLP